MEKGGTSISLVGFNSTVATDSCADLVANDQRIGVVLTAEIRNTFSFPITTRLVLCCESVIGDNATALVKKAAGEIENCEYVKVAGQMDFETQLRRVLNMAEPEPMVVKPIQLASAGNGVRLTLRAFVYQNGDPTADGPAEIKRLVMLAVSNGLGATHSGVSTYYYQLCKDRGVVKPSLRGKKRTKLHSTEYFEASEVNAFLGLLTQMVDTFPGFIDALKREREENQTVIAQLKGEKVELSDKLAQLADFFQRLKSTG